MAKAKERVVMPPAKIQPEPRKDLAYEWVAEYTDGTSTKQYDDEADLEHHFGHIDQSKLSKLSLVGSRENGTYTMDYETGLFYNNGKKLEVGLDYSGKDFSVKPILFRRVQRLLLNDMSTAGVRIVYFLGWEGTVDGEKEKHGLQIFEDGTFAIPPEDSFHAQGN